MALSRHGLRYAPDIATPKDLRTPIIIAVLLGCVLRRSAVAAFTDGRSSDGTPDAAGRRTARELLGCRPGWGAALTMGGPRPAAGCCVVERGTGAGGRGLTRLERQSTPELG